MSLLKENPFDYLEALENAVRSKGVSLPRDEVEREEFAGIGFQVGSDTLMVKIDEISEIIDVPNCTRVHGTKNWFLGLANVRGSLLPVTDLHVYLDETGKSKSHTAQVIIYEKEGLFAGLKVDQILGMKHFIIGEELKEKEVKNEMIRPYIEEQYAQEGAIWSVFNIRSCVEDERFNQLRN